MSAPAQTLRKPAFLESVSGEPATPARFGVSRARELKPTPQPPPASPEIIEARRQEVATHALERIESALSVLRSQGERLAEQARSDALELAFLVARRILEHEISVDPGALLALIRSAIAKAGEANRISLHLNPKDVEAFKAAQKDDGAGLSLARIELVPDGGLEHGDCLVETELGTVDGRLTTRLAEMREAVSSAVGGKSA